MATIHWTGSVNNDFNTAGNWDTATVPGSGDDVFISLAAAAVTSSTSNQVNTLSVAGTASLTIASGTFTVAAGSGSGNLAGNITIADGAVLSIGGVIVNTGVINESSTGTTTQIVLNQTTDTLQGGGQVVLSANTGNQILGAKSTFQLVNVDNTISGSGQIGAAQMALNNSGVIDADQPSAALTVNTGGNIILNSGTMEATAGANLNIVSPVNNTGGTIEAVGAGSVVFLQATVTGGTVTQSGGGQVKTTGASVVLDGLGLHPVTNGAPIQVADSQTLTLLGNITNNSVFGINSITHNTLLRIGSPIVTLGGTGAIQLSNAANNIIESTSNSAFQLINQGNTISGAGQLGAGSLTFLNNAGLVDANQSSPLVLNTNGQLMVNKATLQASAAGGLLIQSTGVDNAGGVVQALVAGSHVDLSGSSIAGGTLKTANGGVIQTVSGNGTLDGFTFGAITNLGSVQVSEHTILSLFGVLFNGGTITQQQTSTTGTTQIRIGGPSVTLKGAGNLAMSNNVNNEIFGNSGQNQLINFNNIISGAGQLGVGQLTLVNQTSGIINANQPASLSAAGQLIVNTSGNILVNQGLMEDTNTGGMLLQSTTIKNTGGRILSTGAGTHVDLTGGTSIQGGTVQSQGGGIVQIAGSGNSGTLDGSNNGGTVTVAGAFLVDNGGFLSLIGTINNTGTLQQNQVSTSGNTQIRIASQTVTLTGGGQLTMSDANNNLILANSSNQTLVNLNNTISGSGQLGDGQMILVNKSVINANQVPTFTANGQLVLNTGGNLIVNTGTLEDTGPGGLVIQSAVNNAGGTVLSAGAGTHVDLAGGGIQGGLLTTSGGGVIQTASGNGSLDGITSGIITNAGSVQVNDNTTLTLVGTINNTGTLNQNSLGSNTDVRITNYVTMQGGGKWLMSNNANNRMFATNGTFKLVNVDNAIAGGGQFGAGNAVFLVNQSKGVINANQKAALIVNTGGELVTNQGLMESTGTASLNGGLVIQNTAINNTGGTVLAAGPLAHVDLTGGSIQGGTLNSSGGGLVQTVSGNGNLDGITNGVLTNKGTVLVNDNTTLSLEGSIADNGLIFQDAISSSGNTDIRIANQVVTVGGSGLWTMSDNPNNRIFGNNSNFMLNILSGFTLQGAGQLGTGGMELTNGGVIQGNDTNALVVNLGSGNFVNGGLLSASGAGGVALTSGIFTNNASGTVQALDGSSLTFQPGMIDTNLAEGDLVNGFWRAIANGHGATLSITGGPVIRDAARLLLQGSGSVIQSGNGSTFQPLEQTLTNVTSLGNIRILGNRGYVSTLGMIDDGTIQLQGGTFQTNGLTITAPFGWFQGDGVVNEPVTNNRLIEATDSGQVLDITGAISGTGSMQVDNGATIELGGATGETVNYAVGAVATAKLDLPFTFTGTLAGLAPNDVIDIAGINNVTTTSVAGGVLTVTRSSGPNLFLNVSGALAGHNFLISLDGSGGTNLTLDPPGGASAGGGGTGSSAGGGSPAETSNIPDPPVTWVGGVDTNFNTAGNWNPASVPGSSDDAIMTVAGVTVNSGVSNTVNLVDVGATDILNINAGTFNAVNGTGSTGIAGIVNVNNGAILQLGGTIANSGTIGDNSAGTNTQIQFTQTTNTLTGGGKVILSTNSNNLLFTSSGAFTLVNVNNTISGSGNIGNGQGTLTNQGVINANQSAVPLIVNTAGNTINNSGTLEATLGGDLNILSPVNNVGGTIEAIGAGSIVFLQSSVTGGSLITSGGGAIQTSGGSSVLDGLGLHPVTNGAPIQVANNQAITLLGNVTNNSSINLNSTGNNTDLRIGSAIVTLSGGGSINLTNNPNNRILAPANSAFTLINQGNTISGAGQLGAADLTFSNAGQVNANQTGALVVNTSGNLLTNTGLMQSSSTGGLFIQSTSINNQGGTIQALTAGSHVDLSGSGISGGTLKTANGGVIQTVSGNGSLDGITFGTLNNQGLVKVNDLTILTLAGTINNTGTILENQVSTNGSTQIRLGNQTVTLTGGGQLVMSNRGNNLIFGNSGLFQLVNVNNTISGAGQLGDGQMTLVNSGTVNANQTPTFTTSGQLVLNTSGNQVVNTGLLESTAAGGLFIQSTGITNTGGTVLAVGTGHVDLSGSGIAGGTLNTSGGGVIQTVSGNGSLDGFTFGALANQGLVKVNDLTILTLFGAINNTGTILENQVSRNSNTQIRLGGQTVTLTGGGQLVMSNNPSNLIFGNNGLFQLVNVNNTISGAGQLGDGQMTFVNNGLVNANQSNALVLNTNGNLVNNTSTLEDTGVGGLVIQSTAVNNTGTILAAGQGSHVDIAGQSSIQGGVLATSSGGVIDTVANDSGFLDGFTGGQVNNTGVVQITDTSTLSLLGTINNTGTFVQAAFSNNTNTDVRIASQLVTLMGGGQWLMSNDVNNRIFANNGAFTFINVDNTISGAGQLGAANAMFVINQGKGVINATQGAALIINTGGDLFTNNGLMESTSAVPLNGGLSIQNTTVNNAGVGGEIPVPGTIQAIGAAAHVDLVGSTIEGGLLTTSGGGVIQTLTSNNATLDGITTGQLTNSGTLVVNDTSTLFMTGSIRNTGTILEGAFSANSNTDIRLSGTVSLTGPGVLLMTDNPNNRIFGNSASFLLQNTSLIKGAGQLGAGQMELNNIAFIQATGVNPLIVDLGGSGNGTNSGSMTAIGAGGMILANGIFTNTGTMTAQDGSAVTFQSGMANTSLAEGDLTAGTWQATASGHGATVSLTGGPIVRDAATLILSGAGSVIQAGTGSGGTPYTPVEQTLTDIVAGGQLQVLNSRGYSSPQSLTDAGTIQLAGGTFLTNSLATAVGGRFFGNGTVQETAINGSFAAGNTGFSSDYAFVPSNGTVFTSDGQYSVTSNPGVGFTNGYLSYGDEDGDGNMLFVDGPASSSSAFWRENVSLAGATTYTFTYFATMANGGALSASQEANIATLVNGSQFGFSTVISSQGGSPWQQVISTFTTGAAGVYTLEMHDLGTSNPGDFTVDNISLTSSVGTGVVLNSGTLEAQGGVLTMSNVVLGSGRLQADAGATLALNGAGANTAGTVLDNGTVSIAAGDSLQVTGSVDPTSTGVFQLNNATVLEVAVDQGASNQMSFLGSSGNPELIVDHASQFGTNVGTTSYTGPLMLNFGVGDEIDLKDVVFGGLTPNYTSGTGLLQVNNGSSNVATLAFQNSSLGAGSFFLTNDGLGGTMVTHHI